MDQTTLVCQYEVVILHVANCLSAAFPVGALVSLIFLASLSMAVDLEADNRSWLD